MPRELVSHKFNGLNEAIQVLVLDEPGSGGACHQYRLVQGDPSFVVDIPFQNGPIGEVGVNGISNEALLAIVEDRLLGFQSGRYVCRENELALIALQECLMWLQKRTLDRMRRGVEGTHAK